MTYSCTDTDDIDHGRRIKTHLVPGNWLRTTISATFLRSVSVLEIWKSIYARIKGVMYPPGIVTSDTEYDCLHVRASVNTDARSNRSSCWIIVVESQIIMKWGLTTHCCMAARF